MLYTFNLYVVLRQLHLNKPRKKYFSLQNSLDRQVLPPPCWQVDIHQDKLSRKVSRGAHILLQQYGPLGVSEVGFSRSSAEMQFGVKVVY